MVAPDDYAITLTVNDVDVTDLAPFSEYEFKDHATQISWFRFKLDAKPSSFTPTKNQTVKVVETTNNATIFLGYIVELKESKRDNGIVTQYMIDAADYKWRLDNTVFDTSVLTGSDATILSNFLSNAHPDLSDLFDFSGGVSGFVDSLELPVGNKSILDALDDLSKLAGGANYRFENVLTGGSVDFDGGLAYTTGSTGFSASVTTGGNPGQCLRGTATNPSTSDYIEVTYDYGSNVTLDSISTDFWVDVPSTSDWQIAYYVDGVPRGTLNSGTEDAGWTTSVTGTTTGNPNYPGFFTGQEFTLRLRVSDGTPAVGTWEFRLDNITFGFNGVPPAGTDQSQLQWDLEPDAADFNFNIDTSDEFGYNFDLEIGDFDDYNSITVIGGSSEEAVVWTYSGNEYQTHYDLELPIEITTIEENTGTDASPTWSALELGTVGQDELGAGSPTIEVLYDPVYHWLEFDSAPATLERSFRVTGNIKRPIRVRVEDIESGDITVATKYEDDSITSEEQAIAIGASLLNQKNAARRLTFTTHNPGLKVGQAINVTDSTRGLNETLKIQSITTRWLSGKLAQFDVECGESDNLTAGEMIAQNHKDSNADLLADTTVTTYRPLTDDDGKYLYDDSGGLLYEG